MSGPLRHSALLTDLYELTMAAAYFDSDFRAPASFELFIRSLPPQRGFLIAAGLEQALEFLESLRFESEEVEYLRHHPVFSHISSDFFDHLRELHFTGEVWATPEGTPMFAEEPILRVTAPLIEAQIVETFLLSTLTFQTMIASKAARVAAAAEGKSVVEFGTRRAHGPEAGVLAGRAAFVGGCHGTSNVEAGQRFGIPTFGTQAHSFVMAFGDEKESFREFLKLFPEHGVLLVDTYDTLAAIDKIVRSGLRPASVRLDSGDLVELSREVRRRLDEGGLKETRIFASGDLDEFVIADLLTRGAQIDAFGVGTALATSKDAPTLSGVYKLVDVETGDGPSCRAKLSNDKATYPCRKQVYRVKDDDGNYRCDIVARETEDYSDAEPLLSCVMRAGKRLQMAPSVQAIQAHTHESLLRLPEPYRRLTGFEKYPVSFSNVLQTRLAEMRERFSSVGKE
jgi:nicotinate phosphoribosyltransferase